MRIEIYRGDHDPPGFHMIIDNAGCVVDLAARGGVIMDKLVTHIIWDDAHPNNGFCGAIYRRQDKVMTEQPLSELTLLEPYIDAYKARMEALSGG